MNFFIKTSIILLLTLQGQWTFGQDIILKKKITPQEQVYIQEVFQKIAVDDQLYRNYISKGTLDETIAAQIDSVYNTHGILEGIKYEKSLNLELPKATVDSLWRLQHGLDLANHFILRGVFETYGWIPESVVEECNYVQSLLLVHPPGHWDVRTFLLDYGSLLKKEVIAGRMPARAYASFYDNIKVKILQEPQLYGTNQQFDAKTKSILPPQIADLESANKARADLGLPSLQVGEYRLLGE